MVEDGTIAAQEGVELIAAMQISPSAQETPRGRGGYDKNYFALTSLPRRRIKVSERNN